MSDIEKLKLEHGLRSLEYGLRSTKVNCLAFVMVTFLCMFAICFWSASGAWKQKQSLIACETGKMRCDIDIRD